MKKIIKNISLLGLSIFLLSGCEKEYLETTPSDQVSADLVFNTVNGAYVALNGTYRLMWASSSPNAPTPTDHARFGQKAVDITMDVMANDVVINGTSYGWYNAEQRFISQLNAAANQRSEAIWAYYYEVINNSNQIIANIDAASGAVPDKENIKGQALALRAYNYFYLVNLFQHTYKGNESAPGVPLYTTPTTVGAARGTVQQVYTQIIEDLTQAETLLTGKTRKHISHINAATVKGIRARVALQMEDWATAATKAAEARQGATLMTTAQYTAGFSKVNPEWIWALEIPNDQSTIFASFFSHYDATRLSYAQLGMQKKITKELYDQIPATDIRKSLFRAPGTGTTTQPEYNSNKFVLAVAGSWAGDYIMMRAAEMYLIEAEAKARQGAAGEARALLQTLVGARNPAYVVLPTLSGEALINEILLQRRIELWGEGFSLLDLKRLKQPLNRPSGVGNHQSAVAVEFSMPTQDPKFLFRIPQSEINANENITDADQNPAAK